MAGKEPAMNWLDRSKAFFWWCAGAWLSIQALNILLAVAAELRWIDFVFGYM